MWAEITIIGSDIYCRQGAAKAGEDVRIALTTETLARLQVWAKQYERAVNTGDPSSLFDLGADLFAWLNATG